VSSIARREQISTEIVAQTGHDVSENLQVGTIGKVDLLVTCLGQPSRVVLLQDPGLKVIEQLRDVADVAVVPEGMLLENATSWPKLGRARWLLAFGECRPVSEWAKDPRCRVPEKSLRRRIDQEWDAEKAISEPPKDVSPKSKKTEKPYAEFPLQKHSSGQWCKKIAGKLYYFGSGTWQEALERFQKEHDSIRLGKRLIDTPTVGDLVNEFLEAKKTAQESGELATRTFNDYHAICERLVAYFGKQQQIGQLSPARFTEFRRELQKGVSVITLGNRVRMCRVVFRFAHESRLIDKPIDLANCFELPPAKAARKQRWDRQQRDGFRMFDPEEIGSLLEVLQNPLRSMVLLGLNCGLGNTDCSELTLSAVNLQRAWLTFPRPKTMVMRDCPLWPETVEALREQIASRPLARSPEFENRVFLTKSGRSWVKITKNGANDDAIAKEFSKVLQDLKIKRPGLNFYALRHTFQTVGESSGDLVAVRSIMGHVDASMSGVYREFVSEERLRAVTDAVRRIVLSVQQ
jgi:integrase